VNWAKVATSITRGKTWREEAKLMKSRFVDLSGRGGGKGSNKFEHKFYKSE
jgi:hypothetical protein